MAAVAHISPQRSAALKLANSARTVMADIKRDLGEQGTRAAISELARLLHEEPGRVGAMRVHEFLELAPRLGDVKVRKILQAPNPPIWPLKRVRDLTDRQRTLLVAELTVFASRFRAAL